MVLLHTTEQRYCLGVLWGISLYAAASGSSIIAHIENTSVR